MNTLGSLPVPPAIVIPIRPSQRPPVYRVTRDALASPCVRVFTWGNGARPKHGLLVVDDSGIHAYENRCPHWNIPLDNGGGRLLSSSGALVCDAHGAEFRPDNGLCVAGPCEGQRLVALDVEVGEDTVEVFVRSLV